MKAYSNDFFSNITFYVLKKKVVSNVTIDIKSLQNRLLKVCCVPATSAGLPRVSFFNSFFLLQRPFTVLMKQTRKGVRTVKQSIYSQMSMNVTQLKGNKLAAVFRHSCNVPTFLLRNKKCYNKQYLILYLIQFVMNIPR